MTRYKPSEIHDVKERPKPPLFAQNSATPDALPIEELEVVLVLDVWQRMFLV